MIISLQLRHYRIYKNIHYIPITHGDKFTTYIGQNGIGKTSILCALDKFFNYESAKEWNIAKNSNISKKNQAYVIPTFLIEKSKIKGEIKQKLAQALNDYFRNTEIKTSAAKEQNKFFDDRNQIISNSKYDDFYFFAIGKAFDNKTLAPHFGIFDSDKLLKQKLEEFDEKNIKDFLNYIVSLYHYIYIPVEIDIGTFTKLEEKNMNILLDNEIKSNIKNSISTVNIREINTKLSQFLGTLENDLEDFKYDRKGNKAYFTQEDLIEKIITSYLSIKVLHKKNINGNIPVNELSSGEKRKALIQIITKLLKKQNSRKREIILAIDEPEASLHSSNCYNQFEILNNISENEVQVLLTTHWYGLIPILSKGNIININKDKVTDELKFILINLFNFSQNLKTAKETYKKDLSLDINLKSYNDLIQSVIYSLQSEPSYNWIICEGISEQIYFEHLFKEFNLKILPAGGCSKVKKIYEYLLPPIIEYEKENEIKGKILCLIDTDDKLIENISKSNSSKLKFYKLAREKNNEIKLVNAWDPIATGVTEIEHSLDSDIFKEALKRFENNYEDKISSITSVVNLPFLEKTVSTLDLRISEQENLTYFFDDNKGENKVLFAKEYVNIISEKNYKHSLKWIKEIEDFFRS